MGVVAVGVDGSDRSVPALEWAAAQIEGDRKGLELKAIGLVEAANQGARSRVIAPLKG